MIVDGISGISRKTNDITTNQVNKLREEFDKKLYKTNENLTKYKKSNDEKIKKIDVKLYNI